jgi:NitT/TauT family transport system substrate-binding protein
VTTTGRLWEECLVRTIKSLLALAASVAGAAVILGAAHGPAQAQTKITVGKILGGVGLHIPSYIAMDRGFFKDEGLDARFVSLVGRPMITAGLSGNLDFVPIPSGGAQAVLNGAKLRYVVGQSLKPQWIIVTGANVNTPQDLKGKTLGYARAGAADYDEGATVMSRFFNMQVGRDYKVISFQGEPERMAALINGDIQGALVSAPRVPKALEAGMKALLRTGDYVPRAGGTIWTQKAYVDRNPETVKKVIRAVAKGVMYFRDNRAGSIPSLKEHFGIQSDQEAGVIWDQLHNTFGAEMPADLFREILEARRQTMIAANLWPKDKPLPDPEQFLTRDLLDSTLKEMGYVPTKLDAPSN